MTVHDSLIILLVPGGNPTVGATCDFFGFSPLVCADAPDIQALPTTHTVTATSTAITTISTDMEPIIVNHCTDYDPFISKDDCEIIEVQYYVIATEALTSFHFLDIILFFHKVDLDGSS